jgi:hypothetical protein
VNHFISNNKGIVLDENLLEYELVAVDPTLVIYHQFLNQLHLPYQKWTYSKQEVGRILIEFPDKMEILDAILFKSLDLKTCVTPIQLYTYSLLQAYFGTKEIFDGIGIIRDRKNHFIFLNQSIAFDFKETKQFEATNFNLILMKHLRKDDLLNAYESFFVLLDQKFEEKLMNALTMYQTETGHVIAKQEWIQKFMDYERLIALKHATKRQLMSL